MFVHKYSVVGCPKEIKRDEYRVGITPSKVKKLTSQGTHVIIGKNAGFDSGFFDEDYKAAGAMVVRDTDVYKYSQVIVKIAEPQTSEIEMIRPGQIVFGSFAQCTKSIKIMNAMKDSKATFIDFDKVVPDMSEIAGVLAIQKGMQFLDKSFGGNGILLSGMSSILPGNVCIIGAGAKGFNAALFSAKLGANVFIMEKDAAKVGALRKFFNTRVNVEVIQAQEAYQLEPYLEIADLMVGATGQSGKIIGTDTIKRMKQGAVFVDLCVGGMTDVSIPTSFEKPFSYHDVLFYCVDNLPSCVPMTSSPAFAKATFPYIEKTVKFGLERSCIASSAILFV
jgi:alanine dehydrogenase